MTEDDVIKPINFIYAAYNSWQTKRLNLLF